MIPLRVLVIIIVVVLAIYWLRRKLRPRDKDPVDGTQALVQCDFCKVRFPATEAVKHQSLIYCCEAHRSAARQAQ